MTNKETQAQAAKKSETPQPARGKDGKLVPGADEFFTKGGYQPAESAPANPKLPGKSGTPSEPAASSE